MSYEQKAMDAHFASPSSSQQATIVDRYKDIRDNIAGKTYTCAKKGKKVKQGNTIESTSPKKRHWPAIAEWRVFSMCLLAVACIW